MAISFTAYAGGTDNIRSYVDGLDRNAPYYYRIIFKLDGDIDGDYTLVEGVTFKSHTFNNLNPDTRYLVEAEVWNQEDQIRLFWDYYNIRTDGTGLSPPTFSITDIASNSAKVDFNKPSGATTCGVYIRPVNSGLDRGWIYDYSTSPGLVDKLNSYDGGGALQPGTTYYIAMDAYDGNNSSSLSASQSFTTLGNVLATPTFDYDYTQKTHNTISVRANAVLNADYYYFEIWNEAFTTRIDYQNSTSRTAYFGGLSTGTTYKLRVKVTAIGYADSAWSSIATATTTIAVGWNWEHSTRPGDPIALAWDEWRDFQDRINEVRYGNGYRDYTFTTSTTEIYSGKPIKAYHFNEAIDAINLMLSSANDMSTVSVGDQITSAKMIEMKDKLNSCIV